MSINAFLALSSRSLLSAALLSVRISLARHVQRHFSLLRSSASAQISSSLSISTYTHNRIAALRMQLRSTASRS